MSNLRYSRVQEPPPSQASRWETTVQTDALEKLRRMVRPPEAQRDTIVRPVQAAVDARADFRPPTRISSSPAGPQGVPANIPGPLGGRSQRSWDDRASIPSMPRDDRLPAPREGRPPPVPVPVPPTSSQPHPKSTEGALLGPSAVRVIRRDNDSPPRWRRDLGKEWMSEDSPLRLDEDRSWAGKGSTQSGSAYQGSDAGGSSSPARLISSPQPAGDDSERLRSELEAERSARAKEISELSTKLAQQKNRLQEVQTAGVRLAKEATEQRQAAHEAITALAKAREASAGANPNDTVSLRAEVRRLDELLHGQGEVASQLQREATQLRVKNGELRIELVLAHGASGKSGGGMQEELHADVLASQLRSTAGLLADIEADNTGLRERETVALQQAAEWQRMNARQDQAMMIASAKVEAKEAGIRRLEAEFRDTVKKLERILSQRNEAKLQIRKAGDSDAPDPVPRAVAPRSPPAPPTGASSKGPREEDTAAVGGPEAGAPEPAGAGEGPGAGGAQEGAADGTAAPDASPAAPWPGQSEGGPTSVPQDGDSGPRAGDDPGAAVAPGTDAGGESGPNAAPPEPAAGEPAPAAAAATGAASAS
mmetsp:Transcript_72606/g.193661  ORF Transcript_72606/g.193661 Transcript_72606/m.193661 type:complete len:595 (+) Transcript_72606:53-1837(+)